MKIVNRTPKEVYNIWIKALRSGKYEQTDSMLISPAIHSEEADRFCCLGVLCDLAAKDGGEQWNIDGYGENRATAFLPTHMRRYIKMQVSEQQRLVKMNDNGQSFESIASEIEKIRDKAILRKSVI